MQSNYNYGDLGVVLDNGLITLDVSISDYPKLTMVEYSNINSTKSLGSTITVAGLVFYLESISIDLPPLEIEDMGLKHQITYNYSHVSKLVYEYPIPAKQFVDKYKRSATKKTKDSYYFSIGTLVGYANSLSTGGNVIPFAFSFEISKTPSAEETITVRQFCDAKAVVKGFIYHFTGSSLGFSNPGALGRVTGDIIQNYTVGYARVPIYRNTILNWSKKDNYDEEDSIVAKKFVEIKDREYVLYEGDYNPHIAPPETNDNTKVPRDLSIMADNSGITKQFKITKYKWGQPSVELSGTYGFAHCALELVSDPEKPNTLSETVLNLLSEKSLDSTNAYQDLLGSIQGQQFGFPDEFVFSNGLVWRLINVKITTYIYKPLTYSIFPQLQKADGTLEAVTVDPVYEKYLKSNLQILVAEETVGWDLKRFAQEDATNWSKGSIQAWLQLKAIKDLRDSFLQDADKQFRQLYYQMLYNAKVSLEQYLYRKIPLFERVDYAIEPYSRFYKDSDKVDWEVQYIPRNKIGNISNGTDETLVPVLFPDPNWIPQLMIAARSRYKTSIGLSGNPEYNPQARNYFGTNPITITTGSEEYEFTKYTVLPSKSTRKNIAEQFSVFANIEDIVDSVQTLQDLKGTIYTPHANMEIGDYGIKGYPAQNVNAEKVLGQYPSYPDNKRDDSYTTTTTLRVAQDQSYKSNITTSNYNLAQGRPPAATTRKPVYEEVPLDNGNKDNPYKNTITLISSPRPKNSEVIASINIDGAENIQDALKGARHKMQLDILNSGNTLSAQLTFLAFTNRSLVNKTITVPQVTGNWIIKRCSQTLQFLGSVPFAQPIQIEAGIFGSVAISSKTVPNNSEDSANKDSVSVNVTIDLPKHFGTPIDKIPSNFSRWLDIS